MSDTPVVVIPRKGYVDGHHGYHHSYHSGLNLLLRLLQAFATAAAVIVMLLATQTEFTRYGEVRGRWRDYPAYKWFIIANAVVFVYALLATLVACCALIARRGPLSYSPSAWLTFLLDFVAASALMSAASAALAVALIARNGQDLQGQHYWPTFCNYVTRFCDYAQGAIIASFCGFGLLALSTLLAASALHHLAWHRLH